MKVHPFGLLLLGTLALASCGQQLSSQTAAPAADAADVPAAVADLPDADTAADVAVADGPDAAPEPEALTAQATTGTRLSFAPPTLKNPVRVSFPSSSGSLSLKLDDSKDYIVDIGGAGSNRVTYKEGAKGSIYGGHNVVIIGGTINAPGSSRALYIQSQEGTVHVEGLRFTGKGLGDAINISAPRARVQLQNIVIDGVYGSYSGHHADCIQNWAGPRVLLVDRLDCTTQYQGVMSQPHQFSSAAVEKEEFRNSVFRHVPQPDGSYSGYLFYKAGSDYPVIMKNVVYVDPKKTDALKLFYGKDPIDDLSGLRMGPASTPSPVVGGPGENYKSPGYAD